MHIIKCRTEADNLLFSFLVERICIGSVTVILAPKSYAGERAGQGEDEHF